MKKRFMAIFIALFFCLSFITPVYAAVFLAPKFSVPAGYIPVPAESLNNLNAVKNDANSFMDAYYGKPGYFKDSAEIDVDVSRALSWQMYNVSDSASMQINNPILFYELGNLGTPSSFNGERQFLGQTKRGQVITNVRYPLVNVYWTFLEDDNVRWIKDPWNDGQLKQWWKGLTGTNTDITMTEFDQKARGDSNYAELINFCIKAANAVQLRYEGGKAYPISDIFTRENRLVFKANVNGKNPADELNLENNIMVITIKPVQKGGWELLCKSC